MTIKPNVSLKLGITGEFEIFVIRNAGTAEEKTENCGRHKNKILDQGLDWWGNGAITGFSSSWNGIAVGTGNIPPAAGQTQLSTPLAFHANANSGIFNAASTSAPYSVQYYAQTTFPVGAVVGNIAELGMLIDSTPAANGKLFSRALIQVGGSPGTITVTASDQLIVNYYCQVNFPDETSGSFTLTTDGTPSTITWQCLPWGLANRSGVGPGVPIAQWNDGFTNMSFLQANSSFLPVTTVSEPSNAVSAVKGSYTNGAFNVNFTVTVNAGSAATYQLCGLATTLFCFQFLLGTAINQLNTQTFQIVYNMSWSDVS